MAERRVGSGAAIYVAGTGTAVGKTWVAVALCRAMRARGLRVGVLKPAESGCPDPDRPADALALIEASGCEAALDVVCPYRFTEPLAPGIAAERAGVAIDPLLLHANLDYLRSEHEVVVCEGAGGLLVPLAGELLNVDWVAQADVPVLLVGRLGLGTVNHTLLSVRCLEERQVRLLATVLSDTESSPGVAAETNTSVLLRYPEVRLAGVMRHRASVLPEGLVEQVVGALDLPAAE